MFKWVGKLKNYGMKEAGNLIGAKQEGQLRGTMQDQARVLLDPRQKRQSREETFQNAYSRQGLDETTLAKVYNTHRQRFYVALVFMVVAMGLGVAGFLSTHWWIGAPSLAIVAVCLSQMFNSSLRTYQINHRELVGINVWWDATTEWWPGAFVTLDEFQKILAKKERRAARRAARKSGALVPTAPTDER